jgi:putative membrane protein
MRRPLVFAMILGCATMVQTTAQGQGIPGAPTGLVVRLDGTEARLTPGDPTAFVLKASEATANTLEAGRLAGTKATTVEVKAFADRLVRDHSKASAELTAFARTRGVRTRPEAAATFVTAALSAFSGDGFDRAFVTQVMLDHRVAVALCDEESRSGKDADIRAWAVRALPTLRAHLKVAEALHARLDESRE